MNGVTGQGFVFRLSTLSFCDIGEVRMKQFGLPNFIVQQFRQCRPETCRFRAGDVSLSTIPVLQPLSV
jgi:hypothetical protein